MSFVFVTHTTPKRLIWVKWFIQFCVQNEPCPHFTTSVSICISSYQTKSQAKTPEFREKKALFRHLWNKLIIIKKIILAVMLDCITLNYNHKSITFNNLSDIKTFCSASTRLWIFNEIVILSSYKHTYLLIERSHLCSGIY